MASEPPSATSLSPEAGQTAKAAEDSLELALRLQGLNIYLVGMMGAGKSSVGRPLAEALGYRFIDADSVLEQHAGHSIPELFEQQGEAGFRELESAVLNRIACWHSLVVATGGGVVSRPGNWGQMRQGLVVWLDAPEQLLLERLRNDPGQRPLLANADPEGRLRQLLRERRHLYSQADLRVLQDGRAAVAVARQVLEAIPTVLRQREEPPEALAQLVDGSGSSTANLNTCSDLNGSQA
ncbi:shikimate kinase [Synechococcus sp. BSF8S]|uniref:shikimate kinase n=1 Tax=Synechococcales TaxID=1890424 RepID=UPI001629624E|nr:MULTISPECIES: shikimate kinase [unclassified Synechococcus]MBC1262161.1 shikimate kinase [Synechococcus sp. BSF8S]MBC1265088.1 shikimate kinase [Synechococcus sp. BSA11S]